MESQAAPVIAELADALSRVVRLGGLPRFTEQVAARSGIHLDRSAYMLLATLVTEPRRTGELAELLNLDVSTVSRKVHTLEKMGLVRREPLPVDRRASLLTVTAVGEATVTAQRRARRELFAQLLADTPLDDLETAARLLHRLADGLEGGANP